MDEERLEAVARNSARRRGSKRTNKTPQGMWLGRARNGNLWFQYPGPLAGRQKSGIVTGKTGNTVQQKFCI